MLQANAALITQMGAIQKELRRAYSFSPSDDLDKYSLGAAYRICSASAWPIEASTLAALGFILGKPSWVKGSHQDNYQRTLFVVKKFGFR